MKLLFYKNDSFCLGDINEGFDKVERSVNYIEQYCFIDGSGEN